VFKFAGAAKTTLALQLYRHPQSSLRTRQYLPSAKEVVLLYRSFHQLQHFFFFCLDPFVST
jgi:hypothetical protein